MTHSGGKPHTNVGDRGQRYEVRSTGYPASLANSEGWAVIGWADTTDGAEKIASAIRMHPNCTSTTIFDRSEKKNVITRFAGILR